MRLLASSICALLLGAACAACGDDQSIDDIDDPDPDPDPDPTTTSRQFTLRIENIAPWHLVKLSSQRTKTTRLEGNLAAGEAYETRFTAGPGHHLTFAMMLRESNDWFIAPEPTGIALFENGQPLAGDITARLQLWDAGTEYDEEPGVGANTGVRQASSIAGDPDSNNLVRVVPDTVALGDGTMFTRPSLASMVRVTLTAPVQNDPYFKLRIENISTDTTLVTSQGTRSVTLSPFVYATHRAPNVFFTADQPSHVGGFDFLVESGQPDPLVDALRYSRGIATPLSRGLFVVHRADGPLFTTGNADLGLGLEGLAEDGDPTTLSGAMAGRDGVVKVGMFDTPIGGVAGPAHAGEMFEVTFEAAPGDRLSFATMFTASNDWFFAPKPAGIELFRGNDPRWGDVTSEVELHDLGTESDEELDVGLATAMHQAAPNTGNMDSNTMVRVVPLPLYQMPESYHLRVTLEPAI